MAFNPIYEKLFAQARSQRDSDEDNSSYFKDPTPGQLASGSEFEQTAGLLPSAKEVAKFLFRKAANRVPEIARTYASPMPGLSDLADKNDPLQQHSTTFLTVGGKRFPLAATFLLGLNAGPTAAGTLEEAKKRGYYK